MLTADGALAGSVHARKDIKDRSPAQYDSPALTLPRSFTGALAAASSLVSAPGSLSTFSRSSKRFRRASSVTWSLPLASFKAWTIASYSLAAR